MARKFAWTNTPGPRQHVHVPKAARVQSMNPSGAILSPKQFHQSGQLQFRHHYGLGQTTLNVSKSGWSFSTKTGNGLPSISSGRRGLRTNIGLGQGYFMRKQLTSSREGYRR